MSNWISVKDRLPPIREGGILSVILLTYAKTLAGNGRIDFDYCDSNGKWFECSGRNWKGSADTVTHWKYLPEPPKEM